MRFWKSITVCVRVHLFTILPHTARQTSNCNKLPFQSLSLWWLWFPCYVSDPHREHSLSWHLFHESVLFLQIRDKMLKRTHFKLGTLVIAACYRNIFFSHFFIWIYEQCRRWLMTGMKGIVAPKRWFTKRYKLKTLYNIPRCHLPKRKYWGNGTSGQA